MGEVTTTNRDESVLTVENLTKRFGGLTAVDDLSFNVRTGEILGFIGPNGAGKSTTFNCIMGTYKPTDGRVVYQGEDVTGLSAHEMVDLGVSRTFQSFRPLNDRTVLENIRLPIAENRLFTLSGLRTKTDTKARELGQEVGLGDRMDMLPNELPHADALRLEIARSLATNPDLLLIDEPFAGLSESEVENLTELFIRVNNSGMTLIVIDHNMRGLLSLVDRAIVINFGSKIAEGAPEQITDDPKVQSAYLGGESI